MHTHFTEGLNIRDMILTKQPKTVLELGAGTGENTRLIQGLLDDYKFNYTVISDCELKGLDKRITFKRGLSYELIPTFPDNSIELCLIDTDHNYWTLAKELTELDPKMAIDGIIMMHDVSHFYHDTGMAMTYSNETIYPEKAILDTGLRQGGIGSALIDFLSFKRFNYKLLSFTQHSYGGATIQKLDIKQVNVYRPGTNPAYVGKQQKEKCAV